MSKKLLLAFCLILFLINKTSASELTSNAESQFVANTVKGITALNNTSNPLWPGFTLTNKPIFIYFPVSQHTYAFNFKPKTHYVFSWPIWNYLHGWEQMTLNDYVYYYADADHTPAEIAVDLDKHKYIPLRKIQGQNVSLYRVDENETSAKELMMNEFKFFSKKISANNRIRTLLTQLPAHPTYDKLNDIDNIALMALEIKLLQNVNTDPNALKYFAAVNHYRLSLLSEDSLNYEKRQDLKNITDYVAWESTFDDTDYSNFLKNHSLTDQVIDDTNLNTLSAPLQVIQKTGLQFNSITAPLIGKKLNELSSQWPKQWTQYRLESVDNMLNEILYQYYQSTQEITEQTILDAKNNYQYDAIVEKVKKIITPFMAKFNEFNNSKNIELNVETTNDEISEHSFMDKSVLPFKIDNHKTFYLSYAYIGDELRASNSYFPLHFHFNTSTTTNNSLLNYPIFVTSIYQQDGSQQWRLSIKLDSDAKVNYVTYGPDNHQPNISLSQFLGLDFNALNSKISELMITTPQAGLNFVAYQDIKLVNDQGALKVVVVKK
jgi:hypothetical protein